MIIEKTILFKLNQIKISDKQLLDSTTPSFDECPSCGAKGCCCPHDSYERDLIFIHHGSRTQESITIQRVWCSSCKKPHALLSDILIPFGSYSLRFVLHVLRAYLIRTETVVALCESFCISTSTLYKWIHLFKLHANLLLSATMQLSWVHMSALLFIEEVVSLPSTFYLRYRFSFLQNAKQRTIVPSYG